MLDHEGPYQEDIQINFFVREGTIWKELPPLTVNPGNTSKVEKAVIEYFWRGFRAFNTKLGLWREITSACPRQNDPK